MEIRFKCPCGRILAGAESCGGSMGKCPACNRRLKVPTPTWRVATAAPAAGKAPPSKPVERASQPRAGRIELPSEPEASGASPPLREAPRTEPVTTEDPVRSMPRAEPATTESPIRSAPRTAPVTTEDLVRSALQDAQPREGESKGRVVVADSMPADLEALRRMLADKGYEVYAAKDGEEAVALIREHRPSLAILDLKTDKLSGFQVVQTITEQYNPMNKDVWQIPFFMTCSKVTGRDRQYAISLGVKQYFVKPLTPAMVCPKIEKQMGFMSGI